MQESQQKEVTRSARMSALVTTRVSFSTAAHGSAISNPPRDLTLNKWNPDRQAGVPIDTPDAPPNRNQNRQYPVHVAVLLEIFPVDESILL